MKIKKYQINCPILKSAEEHKNTLIEAENIKYKLEAKDEEVKELKKSLKLKVSNFVFRQTCWTETTIFLGRRVIGAKGANKFSGEESRDSSERYRREE